MKTLAASEDVRSIVLRLGALTPDDAARWGRMNVHQMICHLCDAMRVPMGEMTVSDAEMHPLSRLVTKCGALYFPLKWPRNLPTPTEIDQSRLNISMGEFEADRQRVIELVPRFCRADLDGRSHPTFGPITRAQWLRWGWLHTDHHLRQLGR